MGASNYRDAHMGSTEQSGQKNCTGKFEKTPFKESKGNKLAYTNTAILVPAIHNT